MGERVVDIRPVWGRKETWEIAAWPRQSEGTGFGRQGGCLPLILLNRSVLLPHNLGPFPLLDIRDLYPPPRPPQIRSASHKLFALRFPVQFAQWEGPAAPLMGGPTSPASTIRTFQKLFLPSASTGLGVVMTSCCH